MISTRFMRRCLAPLLSLVWLTTLFSLSADAAPTCPATIAGPPAVSAGEGISNGGGTWWSDLTLVASIPNQGNDIVLCRYIGTKTTTTPAGTTTVTYRSDKTILSMLAMVLRPKMSYVVLMFDSALNFHCNGVAINPDWILTTKRCVESSLFFQGVGGLDGGLVLGGGDGPSGLFHDGKFIDRIDKNPKTDLAMVHLSSPIVLRSYAPIGYQVTSSSGTAYSWMCWSENNDPGPCPQGQNILRADSIYGITDSSDCQETARFNLGISLVNNTLCVKSPTTFVVGDDGGPLVVNNQVVGIGSKLGTTNPVFGNNYIFFTKVTEDLGRRSGFFTNLTFSDNANWIARYR